MDSSTEDAALCSTASGQGSSNTRQFTGQQADPTGLDHFPFRHYNPVLSRFISADPLGFGGGDLNVFGYVGGSPTNLVDPTGLMAGISASAGAEGAGTPQEASDQTDIDDYLADKGAGTGPNGEPGLGTIPIFAQNIRTIPSQVPLSTIGHQERRRSAINAIARGLLVTILVTAAALSGEIIGAVTAVVFSVVILLVEGPSLSSVLVWGLGIIGGILFAPEVLGFAGAAEVAEHAPLLGAAVGAIFSSLITLIEAGASLEAGE